MKRQTESLIIAARDQALSTNYRKARIEHSRELTMCRMCKTSYKTVTHIISECSELAQTDYDYDLNVVRERELCGDKKRPTKCE